MLLQGGTTISGRYGFKARLVEHGIPEDFKMVQLGYNRENGQFFFIFAPKERPARPIKWQAPVSEREADNELDS